MTNQFQIHFPERCLLNLYWEARGTGLGRGTTLSPYFEGQNPLANVLIKAFRYKDRSVVSEAYSDVNGRARLNLPTADKYLISGVVIRPDENPNYDWISYWPSITIEVIN